MFGPRYQNLRIEPTKDAMRELHHHNCDIDDVVEVLERGYDCSASQRAENIIEKCLGRADKEIRVVVAKASMKYTDDFVEDVWWLIHFGITSRRK